MNKHGEFFPRNPRDIEELLDSLAQRAAQHSAATAHSRPSSVPPEADALAQQAFGSPSLMNALNRLGSHPADARPGEDWTAHSGSPVTSRSGWARVREWPTSPSWSSSPMRCRRNYSRRRWTMSISKRWPVAR